MSVSLDFSDRTVLVTGACGALGSAVARAFETADATVWATDIVDIESDDSLLDPDGIRFVRGDVTNEADVTTIIETVVEESGGLDHCCNVAGTWRGGDTIAETALDEVQFLFDVNVVTAFLVSKHALPHLERAGGTIVNVSSRSSLSGGAGDGPYRASKAAIRILTETIAEEYSGTVRANAVMPSVIDTPMNREMMEPKEEWVDPKDIAQTFLALSSEIMPVTSGAAIPVYGEA